MGFSDLSLWFRVLGLRAENVNHKTFLVADMGPYKHVRGVYVG